MKYFIFYFKTTGRTAIVVSVDDTLDFDNLKELAIQKFKDYMKIETQYEYDTKLGGFDCEEIKVI